MMKHAYLILAHHEFPVLQLLLKAIDDARNDIFIHVDKKVPLLPELKTEHANLYFTEHRIDICWGDVSVVEGEYVLFEAAFKKGRYAYYHLLSGSDMPLHSQNDIHDFFEQHNGKEFIGFYQGAIEQHIDRKVNRYHLFPRHFRDTGGILNLLRKSARYIFLRLQYLFNIRRNKAVTFKKGTQWLSITHDLASYVLQHKERVLKDYSHTFCSDEIFLQTLCWNSPFKDRVFDINSEEKGCQRKIGWKNGVLYDWQESDFDELMQSGLLFARKFNNQQIKLVHRILEQIGINKNTPVITVIVPVYNAERTLHVALDSLVGQTYADLEIILINDCSTDKSLELIQHYAGQLQVKPNVRVKVLSHKQNEGVATARNTGLDNATGDYIYYMDADDWLEADAIELIVEQALRTEADIVGLNWWLSFEKNERKMNQPAFMDPWQAIEWMLLGKMRWNLWMFLVKHQLYTANRIRFTPGMNMGEDMMVMMKLFTCAGKVAYLDKALYHYGKSNEGSLTKVYSERHLAEVTKNVEEAERFLLTSKFATQSAELIDYLKLSIKLPLLISNKKKQFAYWRSWFPEANRLAMSDKNTSLRIRLLQGAAVNKQDWIVKLHYYLVIRLVYGIIYK